MIGGSVTQIISWYLAILVLIGFGIGIIFLIVGLLLPIIVPITGIVYMLSSKKRKAKQAGSNSDEINI